MFHFDVLFSHGSQGDFFDYKLVNIWLDKIRAYCPSIPQARNTASKILIECFSSATDLRAAMGARCPKAPNVSVAASQTSQCSSCKALTKISTGTRVPARPNARMA